MQPNVLWIRLLLHEIILQKLNYGFLSNGNKKSNIKLCRLLISRILSNEFISTISRKFHEFKCEKCGSPRFSYSFCCKIHRLCLA